MHNWLPSFILISIHIESREDFWSYRWIHIADGTSEQPFIVELFSTSQPEIFENIYPSTQFQKFYLFIFGSVGH